MSSDHPHPGPGLVTRFRQLLYRLGAGRLYGLSLRGPEPEALRAMLKDPWLGSATVGQDLLHSRFAFGGQVVERNGAPWRVAGVSPAWLREAHGFAWLRHLEAAGIEQSRARVRALTAEWLVRNRTLNAVRRQPSAWQPDVVGTRLLAWLWHWPAFYRDADDTLRKPLLRSMALHMRHLQAVISLSPPGVERFTALSGLILAHLCLPGMAGGLSRALSRLDQEISTQLLEDGGHISRNPTALAIILRHLAEIRIGFISTGDPVPDFIQTAADQCGAMLRYMRLGDGGLALFNGASAGQPDHLARLLDMAACRKTAPDRAPQSGYERLEAGDTVVLLDSGPPPPVPYDKTAHAGTASFELSVGGQRLFGNCGNLDYLDDRWRAAMRTTAAHSTLLVNNTNSSDVRGVKGFGSRRASVTVRRVVQNGQVWLFTLHAGYRQPFGLTHARRVYLSTDGLDLRGEDRVQGASQGGASAYTIRFHLHPDVEAVPQQDAAAFLLRLPDGTGWWFRCSGAKAALEDSVWLGDGTIRQSRQIMLDGVIEDRDAIIRWAVQKDKSPPAGG